MPLARVLLCIGWLLCVPGLSAQTLKLASHTDSAAHAATLDAYLSQPEGRGPFPAVLLLHGCAGLTESSRRGLETHARALVSAGFSALILDSFSARGKGREVCTNQIELNAARHYRQFDAYHALRYLQSQPFIIADQVFLLGQSQGGSVALMAAAGPHPDTFPSKPRFRGIVAYYPWCGALPTWPVEIVSPLLVFGAGKDEWVPADYCQNAAPNVNGADYNVVIYPEAHHGFDLPIPLQRYAGYLIGEHAASAQASREYLLDWLREQCR